jgi:hypothetical protein
MKLSAWYGILVGALILLQWTFFLTVGAVPELQTAPWEIGFHMTAELALALMLIAGGCATLGLKPWGKPVLLVALGMALYSEINSPGYFAQRGQWTLVVMFGVLLLGALTAVLLIVKPGEAG